MAADPHLLHERFRLSGLDQHRFTPDQLWDALRPAMHPGGPLSVEEIGRSAHGRPLRLFRWGQGPTRVLLWSRTHGDEPTGTMALADLLHLLARSDEERVGRWAQTLTILALPMLNPDGAAAFQRENAQGIDVNRDSRSRWSPEMQVLERVRALHQPAFALTLHDQDIKVRVGDSDRIAAISLQAPSVDERLGDNDARLTAKRLCVAIHDALGALVEGHVARYPDTYDPKICGIHFQQQGTSTVLIETGWWPDDPELQFLRYVNFSALVAAMDAIAHRRFPDASRYEQMPKNNRDVHALLVRGATILVPGLEPYRADLGATAELPLDPEAGTVTAVGNLSDSTGLCTLSAEGLFLHPDPEMLTEADGKAYLGVQYPATFTLRRGTHPDSTVVWRVRRGRVLDGQ